MYQSDVILGPRESQVINPKDLSQPDGQKVVCSSVQWENQ